MEVSGRLERETARDYALRTIKQNIIELVLAPGSMVSENELAAEMGISRTPVREVLIELSKSQIVEIFPQKGSYVSKIDDNLVEEARFMREVLEIGIAELACETADKTGLDELEENVRLQEFYLEKDNYPKLFELDNRYHEKLFEICHKQRTYLLMQSMMIHFDRVRRLKLSHEKAKANVRDHREILGFVRSGEKEMVRKQMKVHLRRYESNREELLKQYPEYFKSALI